MQFREQRISRVLCDMALYGYPYVNCTLKTSKIVASHTHVPKCPFRQMKGVPSHREAKVGGPSLNGQYISAYQFLASEDQYAGTEVQVWLINPKEGMWVTKFLPMRNVFEILVHENVIQKFLCHSQSSSSIFAGKMSLSYPTPWRTSDRQKTSTSSMLTVAMTSYST